MAAKKRKSSRARGVVPHGVVAPANRRANALIPADPVLQPGALVQLFGKLIDPTGQAAAGVGVILGFRMDEVHVANTVSDSNGAFVLTYVASAVPTLRPDDAPVLYLSVNTNPVALVTQAGPLVLGDLVTSAAASIYGPIQVVTETPQPAGQTSVAPRARLLGDNGTLLAVVKRAPGLFTRPVPANASGCCGPASPSDVATRVYYINRFTMFNQSPLTPAGLAAIGAGLAPLSPIPAAAVPAPPAPLRFGAMIQFRQEWWDLGFSLGDLLYSIPLAPGEETNIATVDWRRQDYAKRNTALDESNYQDTTITRDQAIDEAVNMMSDKTATDTTGSAGVGISFGPFSLGAAGGSQTMTDVVNATSDAATNINDKVHQASVTTRQTKAYSIVETTQQEQATVSTRVLRNHNHCHTVTFQYFEVLRQFRISTKPVDIRPLLFVPLQPIQFGLADVLQHGYLLRRGLVDSTLQPVLDEFLGATAPATTASANIAPPPSGTAGSYQTFQVSLFVDQTRVNTLHNGLWLMIDDDIVGAAAGAVAGTNPFTWQYTFATPKAFPGIQKIGLVNVLQSGQPTGPIDDLSISAVNSDGSTQLVYFKPTVSIDFPRMFTDAVSNSIIPTLGSAQGGPDLTRLLSHLNGNSLYYTILLFMAGDASTRYGQLGALADYVENRVIGRIGPYVGMPLQNSNLLPPQFRGPAEVPVLEKERLITLPTPGVFAESQLGSCSACETIDDTVFWDWQKSPTPESAPDITAAMLQSRFQDLSSMTLPTQSNLQAPPVQVPTEPAPPITIGDQTMAALVSNLQLTNASDVTALVNSLIAASTQGYNSMVKANQGSPGMTAPGAGASGAAGGGAGGGGANLTPSTQAMVPNDAIMALA